MFGSQKKCHSNPLLSFTLGGKAARSGQQSPCVYWKSIYKNIISKEGVSENIPVNPIIEIVKRFISKKKLFIIKTLHQKKIFEVLFVGSQTIFFTIFIKISQDFAAFFFIELSLKTTLSAWKKIFHHVVSVGRSLLHGFKIWSSKNRSLPLFLCVVDITVSLAIVVQSSSMTQRSMLVIVLKVNYIYI